MAFKPVIAQENTKDMELNEIQTTEDTTIYIVTDTIPEYPDGEEALFKFILKNVVYPKEAYGKGKKGIEGRVMIGFVVEKDGSLTNFEIVRTPHSILGEEALRVVKLMPKWIPGKKDGKVVRVKFQLPVDFVLH
jgi:protein TonB